MKDLHPPIASQIKNRGIHRTFFRYFMLRRDFLRFNAFFFPSGSSGHQQTIPRNRCHRHRNTERHCDCSYCFCLFHSFLPSSFFPYFPCFLYQTYSHFTTIFKFYLLSCPKIILFCQKISPICLITDQICNILSIPRLIPFKESPHSTPHHAIPYSIATPGSPSVPAESRLNRFSPTAR